MAKQKQTQTIELDVIAKGLETTEKNFKKLVGNTGDMSKKAQSVLSDVEKIRKLIVKNYFIGLRKGSYILHQEAYFILVMMKDIILSG